MPKAAPWVLYGLAFTWPWDVYQSVPLLNVALTTMLGIALVVLCLAGVVRSGRFQGPFELIWPGVALIAMAACGILSRAGPPWGAALGSGAAFLAVLHFARPRATVIGCLWLSTLAGGGVGLLSLLGQARCILPTAFSPETGAALAFASTLEGGALTLALCCATAGVLAVSPIPAPGMRWSAAASGLVSAVALAVLALRSLPRAGFWHPPDWVSLLPLALVAMSLALWLTMRVAAKLTVARLEDAPGIHVGLLAVLAVGIVMSLALPQQPQLGHGVFLGLLAGYSLPSRQQGSARPMPIAVLAVVLLMVLANLWHLSPDNPRDPRNYEHSAARLFESGRLTELERRLDFIDGIAPEELRTHLWRARIRLEAGDPEATASALSRALRQGRPRILPGPSQEETEQFLTRLRDHCSALPENARGLAYERALLAAGERASALAALRLRGQGGAGPAVDTRPLSRALAHLLGDRTLAGPLAQWDGAQLLRVLETLGAEVQRVPEGFHAPHLLPLVLLAQVREDKRAITAYAGAITFGGVRRNPPGTVPPDAHDASLPAPVGWSALFRDGQGWSCRFEDSDVVRLWQSPRVAFPDPPALLRPTGLGVIQVFVP